MQRHERFRPAVLLRRPRLKGRALIIVALLVVQACTYAISPDLAKQADRTITFADLQAFPGRYAGRLVILGGAVARVRNTGQGTVIEVAHKKLDLWGKPLREQPGGSFVVVVNANISSPLTGQDITVAGTVAGAQPAVLEGIPDTAPVLQCRELKEWPPEIPSWNRPHYLDPLYDPLSSPRQF